MPGHGVEYDEPSKSSSDTCPVQECCLYSLERRYRESVVLMITSASHTGERAGAIRVGLKESRVSAAMCVEDLRPERCPQFSLTPTGAAHLPTPKQSGAKV